MGPIVGTFEDCDECGSAAMVAVVGGAKLCRRCLGDAAVAIVRASKMARYAGAKSCKGCGMACGCEAER